MSVPADGNSAPPRRLLLAIVPVAFAALVFHSITGNYFYTDDFLNLYEISHDGFFRFVPEPSAGHLYLLRNAIFYLTYVLLGPHPAGYYWSAFLTHLLNVFLLFRVLEVFLGSDRLACFGATLWGVSPINEGSLGWYSVYGHVLATTLVLSVVLDVGRCRTAGAPPRTRRICRWLVLLVTAASIT